MRFISNYFILIFDTLKVEADLRVAQSEYDRQLEVMRILIESANSAQVYFLF